MMRKLSSNFEIVILANESVLLYKSEFPLRGDIWILHPLTADIAQAKTFKILHVLSITHATDLLSCFYLPSVFHQQPEGRVVQRTIKLIQD